MICTLAKGLTNKVIFIWFVERIHDTFKDASLYVSAEQGTPQRFTLNLNMAMYESLCNFEEPMDIVLKCADGNEISYSSDEKGILRISGTDAFAQTVARCVPPKKLVPPHYGDYANSWKFRMSEHFCACSAAEKMQQCINIASENKGRMFVSAGESKGCTVAVQSVFMLPSYEDLMDIIVYWDAKKWILCHMYSEMVYSSGFEPLAARKLLENIIVSK